MSYYLNYEKEDGNPYHWIDDCDYGGVIEFIPPEPKREGYSFGGWFKEAECLNEWDFAADTLPEEITEPKEYEVVDTNTWEAIMKVKEVTVYQETVLYAKWVAESDEPTE